MLCVSIISRALRGKFMPIKQMKKLSAEKLGKLSKVTLLEDCKAEMQTHVWPQNFALTKIFFPS